MIGASEPVTFASTILTSAAMRPLFFENAKMQTQPPVPELTLEQNDSIVEDLGIAAQEEA
jgi:hypothetical protein